MIWIAYFLGIASGSMISMIIMMFVKTRIIELSAPELSRIIPRARTNKKKKTPLQYSDKRAYETEKGL